MKKIILPLILVGSLASFPVLAFEPFVVKNIQIKGLKRVSEGAALEDLPLHVGDHLSEAGASDIIHALYKTGFFKEVTLNRVEDTLVVRVVERPSISQLILTGIKDKEKVKKLLKEGGVAEGRFYDPAVLLQVEKELERFYFSRGRYGVKIESKVTEGKDSLVTIQLSIYEGDVARIREIKITGNTHFTEKELMKDFRLSKTNWLSWFTSDNQYNKEKLNADLETLRSYYMDRGYIHFQVDGSQVTLSPDKKHIFIAIQVTEGDLYAFNDAQIEGQFVVPKKELMPLLAPLKPGSTFSRETLLKVKQALEDRLGEDGYSFAEVRPSHEIDEQHKRVDVMFHLAPGKRMYVRRILIQGNLTTKDEVLRRELLQMEGTWISTGLVREGKEKILRRGYGSTVDVETPAVPGTTDQVDVIYKIEEAKLGQIGAGLAYSPTEKFMINFSISQENFFGTGNIVDFTFDKGKTASNYAFGFQDPYFTVDGIGMGFSVYNNKCDLSKTTNISNYATDTLGGEVRWVFPTGKYEALRCSLGYDNTRLKIIEPSSQEVKDFATTYGRQFREFVVGGGWSYDSLDQRIFPKKGLSQSLDLRAVIPGANQQYYKIHYDVKYYYPLSASERWIASFNSNLGFGNGYGKTPRMPFYRQYTTGGIHSIRGFEENSLGPKDSTGRSFGGNVLLTASAALIFPNPIKPDLKSVRTALFFDAGQVYDTKYRQKMVNGKMVNRNPSGLRYSVGVSLTWHTPLGAPLSFSFAKPLNVKPEDEKRYFTFSMATQF